MSEIQLNGVDFEIKFKAGNAAVVDDPNAETIRILQKIIAVLADNAPATGVGGVVKDINGNTIGEWGLYVGTEQLDDEGETIDLPFRDVNV